MATAYDIPPAATDETSVPLAGAGVTRPLSVSSVPTVPDSTTTEVTP